MTDEELLTALDRAAARIIATDRGSFERTVPACPDWTVADVIEHTGSVNRWAATVVRTPGTERLRRSKEPRPAGTDLIAWYAEGAADLATALREVDPDRQVWTFTGARPARWWIRRQAHETTLHAWDVASAGGTTIDIPAELAVDGIDELIEVFLPLLFDAQAFAEPAGTLHFHATDAPGEWLVRVDAEGVSVTREHAKGDVAVRAPAADLLLLLWSKRAADQFEAFGDAALLDRFQSALSI